MLTEAIGVSTLQHTTSTQTCCLQMSLQHLIGIGIGHWYVYINEMAAMWWIAWLAVILFVILPQINCAVMITQTDKVSMEKLIFCLRQNLSLVHS